MISVSPYLINPIFMLTFYMSIYQHVQLKRPNPVLNLQFAMMVFSLLMVLIVALYSRTDPRVSWGFLVTAVVCAAVTYRQFRYLPPKRRYD